MKSFLIYVKGHAKSEQYAEACLQSMKGGFSVQLFEGATADTFQYWEDYFKFPEIHNGRLLAFQQEDVNRYKTKKACVYNHARLWEKCIELDEPICFIEQDSHCVRAWDNLDFDEVLILNATSALLKRGDIGVNRLNLEMFCAQSKSGIQDWSDAPTKYHRKNRMLGHAHNPGNGAYCFTPKAAKKLLHAAEKGVDQGDIFINTSNVNMQYVVPEYFTFKLPNLGMSHGF